MDYKIKKGDTLWDIARANGTTVDAIAAVNGIKNPDLIYAGDTIKIPTASSAKAASTSAGSKSSSASAVNPSQTSLSSASKNTSASYESGKPTYTQSSEVRSALDRLNAKESEKAPEYSSKYKQKIDSLLDSIENREAFSYDFMSDPLYRSYRDRYISDGRRAMKEAAANAAALTGGYSNSYAASASSEAMGRYMTELSGLIPSLYEAALKRYDSEGQALLDRLGIYRGLEGDDYSRYRDLVSDRNDELAYLLKKYETLYDDDFAVYEALLGQWNKDRDYGRSKDEYEADAAYRASRDEAEDAYKKSRDAVEDAFKERELRIKAASAASSKSSSASSGSSSSSSSSSSAKKSSGSIDVSALGAAARRIVNEISRLSPDQRGAVEQSVLERAKKDLKSGALTSKEYNYIKSLF